MPAREKFGITHLFNVIKPRSEPTGSACSGKDMTSDGICAIDMGDEWWIEYEAYTNLPRGKPVTMKTRGEPMSPRI